MLKYRFRSTQFMFQHQFVNWKITTSYRLYGWKSHRKLIVNEFMNWKHPRGSKTPWTWNFLNRLKNLKPSALFSPSTSFTQTWKTNHVLAISDKKIPQNIWSDPNSKLTAVTGNFPAAFCRYKIKRQCQMLSFSMTGTYSQQYIQKKHTLKG